MHNANSGPPSTCMLEVSAQSQASEARSFRAQKEIFLCTLPQPFSRWLHLFNLSKAGLLASLPHVAWLTHPTRALSAIDKPKMLDNAASLFMGRGFR